MLRQLARPLNLKHSPRLSALLHQQSGSPSPLRETPFFPARNRQEQRWNGQRSTFSDRSVHAALCFSLLISVAGSTAYCDASKKDHKPAAPHHWKTIPRKDVEQHNSLEKGVWVTYNNGVYDVTHFIQNHPGGRERLLGVAGKDIGASWAQFEHHKTSPLALELLEEMKIGELPAADVIVPPKSEHRHKYPTDRVYDVVIIGSGLSGLQCGWSLINQHHVPPERILVLEAQDYVGGRVKQVSEFVKGAKIEVGAEFLHGNNTELTKFAKVTGQPLREIFCWAHGDGGPLPEAVDGGYGLYFVGAADLDRPDAYRLPRPYRDGPEEQRLNRADRLLRYDDKDADFVRLNVALWELEHLHEDDFDERLSLYDWLLGKRLNANMLKMGEGGFANTLCAKSDELSLKQAIKWSRIWHMPPGPGEDEDGDFTFRNSFGALVAHLSKELQIELNSPVSLVRHDPAAPDGSPAGLVRLTTRDGLEYTARNLVVTASPHVIQQKLIDFQPALPAEVAEAFSWVKMNPVVKVILKFSVPVWPRDLHGMIMADDSFLLPEVWFRNVEDEVAEGEPATAYAVGFTTAHYADRLATMSQEEVLRACLAQLEKVFGLLEPRHMSADPDDPRNAQALAALPKASEAFLGGMFWDWRPSHHPFIGGGYCSPLAGKPIAIGEVLKKGNGRHMFFAGEATNDRPGATAHAALETGLRAAGQVASALQQQKN